MNSGMQLKVPNENSSQQMDWGFYGYHGAVLTYGMRKTIKDGLQVWGLIDVKQEACHFSSPSDWLNGPWGYQKLFGLTLVKTFVIIRHAALLHQQQPIMLSYTGQDIHQNMPYWDRYSLQHF